MALFYPDISNILGLPVWLLIIAGVWSIIWKGIALWKSSQKKQLIWFIALLIINTLGILEILYIFLLSKIKFDKNQETKKKTKKRNKTVRRKR